MGFFYYENREWDFYILLIPKFLNPRQSSRSPHAAVSRIHNSKRSVSATFRRRTWPSGDKICFYDREAARGRSTGLHFVLLNTSNQRAGVTVDPRLNCLAFLAFNGDFRPETRSHRRGLWVMESLSSSPVLRTHSEYCFPNVFPALWTVCQPFFPFFKGMYMRRKKCFSFNLFLKKKKTFLKKMNLKGFIFYFYGQPVS